MPNIEVSCFFCGKLSMGLKENVEEMNYTFNRLYYVNEGEAIYKDEKSSKVLQEGHLYILPAKTYSINHTKKKLFYHTWFHIITKSFNISEVIDYDVKKIPTIERFSSLLSLLVDENLSDEQIVDVDSEIFLAIGLIIQALFKAIDAYENFEIEHSHQIRSVLKYITDHLDKNLSNAELAKIAFLNKFYFVKLFTQECNISPQKFIVKARMNHAKNMLTKDIGVEEVAVLLGYPDPKSFSRAFKRDVGISPSSYKKNYLLN